jgi:hypothetical protein
MEDFSTDAAAPLRVGNLRSIQGIKIRTAYNPLFSETESQRLYQVADISFTVEGWDGVAIHANSDVLLVLINRYFRHSRQIQQQVHHIHMLYYQTYQLQTYFIAGIRGALVSRVEDKKSGDVIMCMPQLAVCVDGVWQIDPIQPNEEHNFNFAWKMPSA